MTNFYDFLDEQLKDKELKNEYDALDEEFAAIQKKINAKKAEYSSGNSHLFNTAM